MKMQFVLTPIPEKFSSKGGYNGRFINQKQLDGRAVIEEAIAMDYVPNYTPQQVKACAMGLLESMLAGVARDGNPRSVDGFIKVTPVLKGRFEKADSSYDPKVNAVVVNVQLLHELKPVDTSSWSFINATPKDDPPTPPPPPPTPIWTTEDGQVKVFSASDDETGETFTFGDLWTILGEGFRDSEAGWFAETALIQTAPETEGAALEVGTSDDGEIQLRPEDVTALQPGDYPNAVLSVGFAHNSDEGLVTEGMTLPVHLVVAG